MYVVDEKKSATRCEDPRKETESPEPDYSHVDSEMSKSATPRRQRFYGGLISGLCARQRICQSVSTPSGNDKTVAGK